MDGFDDEGERYYMVDSLLALCSLVDSALKRTEDLRDNNVAEHH